MREDLNLTLTTDIASVPVSSSSHAVETASTVNGLASYGVLDDLDLGIDLSLSNAPSSVFFKYQVLGSSKQVATPRSISLGVVAGAMKDADRVDSETLPTMTASLSLKGKIGFLSEILLGYRFNQSWITLFTLVIKQKKCNND